MQKNEMRIIKQLSPGQHGAGQPCPRHLGWGHDMGLSVFSFVRHNWGFSKLLDKSPRGLTQIWCTYSWWDSPGKLILVTLRWITTVSWHQIYRAAFAHLHKIMGIPIPVISTKTDSCIIKLLSWHCMLWIFHRWPPPPPPPTHTHNNLNVGCVSYLYIHHCIWSVLL